MRRDALAGRALSALRDPLTRIALALQRLESARPHELRERAAAISGALGDVAGRLGELERALGPREQRAHEPRSDCRPALAEIRSRACAALAAHSATLCLAAGAEPVLGDPAAVRRAATRLLRVACLAVREGGEITLSLERAGSGARLGLEVRPTRDSKSALIDELLERFALAEGAELEREPMRAGRPLRVQLRLAAEEAP